MALSTLPQCGTVGGSRIAAMRDNCPSGSAGPQHSGIDVRPPAAPAEQRPPVSRPESNGAFTGIQNYKKQETIAIAANKVCRRSPFSRRFRDKSPSGGGGGGHVSGGGSGGSGGHGGEVRH